VPKLRHNNNYIHDDEERHKKSEKSWLNAYYPIEEPACYLHGDVYFSEEAIKTIVETPVKNTMFFCVRDMQDGRPAGVNFKGREPLAYKVQNQKVFRQAINDLLRMIDEGKFKEDPICWNLYRKINGLPIAFNWWGNDIFKTQGDYKVIDDYTTDIDAEKDIEKLERFIRIVKGVEKMIKVRVIEDFYLGRFGELKNIIRKARNENGKLFIDDTFECTKELADYLLGKNSKQRAFVEVIEVIPEKKEEPKKVEIKEEKQEVKEEKKEITKRLKTTRKSIAKKKKI